MIYVQIKLLEILEFGRKLSMLKQKIEDPKIDLANKRFIHITTKWNYTLKF